MSRLRFLGIITVKIIISQKISKKLLLSWLTRRYNKIFSRRVNLVFSDKTDMQIRVATITVDRIPNHFTINLKACKQAIVQQPSMEVSKNILDDKKEK